MKPRECGAVLCSTVQIYFFLVKVVVDEPVDKVAVSLSPFIVALLNTPCFPQGFCRRAARLRSGQIKTPGILRTLIFCFLRL